MARKKSKMERNKFVGISVVPHPDEDGERLIRRFTKKVRDSKILDEYRLRQGYEKPSVKRRRKSAQARFRLQKLLEG